MILKLIVYYKKAKALLFLVVDYIRIDLRIDLTICQTVA